MEATMWTIVALVGVISSGEAFMFIHPQKHATEAICERVIPTMRQEIVTHLDKTLNKGETVALSISCMNLPVPGQDL
jgi:hypothetical protein